MKKINININKNVFNPSFVPLLEDNHRYLIVYGGGGSGKSFFIAQRYVLKLLKSKCNLLVIRNTGRSNRDSTFALINQVISKWKLSSLFKVNMSDLRITCANGNEIVFSGLDDVEKLKSITFSNGELTDIWVEEASEILESDFNQLDIRLRGGKSKKQIVLSFNPISIEHWLKKRFVDEPSDNVLVHHSTYLDNKFLDDDYKRLLEGYKETDPYYYKVYCLGEWGVYGESIFDTQKINDRLEQLPPVLKVGYFLYNEDMSYEWVDDPKGYIKIYYEPKSEVRYVGGGDTASGVGSDYHILQVLDEDGNQCAVLRNHMDSDLYTRQVYCLGKYYNNALLSIEVNYDMYPIKKLEELGYTYQYVREQQDTFTKSIKKAFGFRTDAYTRPRILSQLVELVREYTYLFNDRDTLNEMLTFVRNDKGRAEAQEGSHDDLVMAIAIAHESIKQIPPKPIVHIEYTEEEEFFDYGI